jgi:GT2 family glycosyltransferase
MDNIEVVVVIPVYNMKDYLNECLVSLLNQTYKRFAVAVINDASEDEVGEMMRQNFPDVRLLNNKIRLGQEASRNIAIKHIKVKYIATLDADTVVDKEWLEELVRAIDSDKDIGMCSCKILKFSPLPTIDNIGHELYYDFSPIHIGANDADRGQSGEIKEIFGICMAGSLIKKEVFDRVGLFDEDYRGSFGDDEWTWRARMAGYRCLFVPTAIMYHRKTTTGVLDKRNIFIWERNRLLSIIKHYSLQMIIISIFYTFKRYVSYLVKGEKEIPLYRIIPGILYAWKEAFKSSFTFIQKRKSNRLDKIALRKMKTRLTKNWPSHGGIF